MLTSVPTEHTIAMLTALCVIIRLDHIAAGVKMDLLETDLTAQVS